MLQKVTRSSSGSYACSALNSEGETISNQLSLRVKCKHPLCRQYYLIKDLPPSRFLENKERHFILIFTLFLVLQILLLKEIFKNFYYVKMTIIKCIGIKNSCFKCKIISVKQSIMDFICIYLPIQKLSVSFVPTFLSSF